MPRIRTLSVMVSLSLFNLVLSHCRHPEQASTASNAPMPVGIDKNSFEKNPKYEDSKVCASPLPDDHQNNQFFSNATSEPLGYYHVLTDQLLLVTEKQAYRVAKTSFDRALAAHADKNSVWLRVLITLPSKKTEQIDFYMGDRSKDFANALPLDPTHDNTNVYESSALTIRAETVKQPPATTFSYVRDIFITAIEERLHKLQQTAAKKPNPGEAIKEALRRDQNYKQYRGIGTGWGHEFDHTLAQLETPSCKAFVGPQKYQQILDRIEQIKKLTGYSSDQPFQLKNIIRWDSAED